MAQRLLISQIFYIPIIYTGTIAKRWKSINIYRFIHHAESAPQRVWMLSHPCRALPSCTVSAMHVYVRQPCWPPQGKQTAELEQQAQSSCAICTTNIAGSCRRIAYAGQVSNIAVRYNAIRSAIANAPQVIQRIAMLCVLL